MTEEELFHEAHAFAIKAARPMVCKDDWERDKEDICQLAAVAAWYAVRKATERGMEKLHTLRYAGLKARGLVWESYYFSPNEHTKRVGSNIKAESMRLLGDSFDDMTAPEYRDYSPIDDDLLKPCSSADRDIVRMYYEQGMSDAEIGKKLGKTPKRVFFDRHRALRRIRVKAIA